ncbi:MAG: hypothetical protein IKS17_02700 [Firmicutes bacterium]|nr:hypothetical protein [Bacillota bacterium]
MRIDIVNKQPIPAIYNVKQYSDAAYSFVFYVPLSEMPNANILSAAVKTINFTDVLDIRTAGDTLVMEWLPDINETKYTGRFDIQLEITGENFVWQSYKAVYIVSAGIAYDPLIYTVSDGAFIDGLETNISDYALFPNLVMTADGWEWKAGRTEQGAPIRTFKETAARPYRNYIEVKNSGISVFSQKLTAPNDIQNITYGQTELLKLNGKQLYFVSLSDFSAGITTLSPKMHNKTISEYTEDMYKCRCLTGVGAKREIFKLSAGVTNNSCEIKTVFKDNNGSEYGNVYREDANGVRVYKKFNGTEYPDIIFKVYQSEEAADEDAENMPENSVGIIKEG